MSCKKDLTHGAAQDCMCLSLGEDTSSVDICMRCNSLAQLIGRFMQANTKTSSKPAVGCLVGCHLSEPMCHPLLPAVQ